ncbi:zinc transporter ZIP1-like [Saccostrea echinata]|uniref:zinc transporter ZIP1-like n=1 Tax=Saccostrea echinata TaxID=191078 RepID=UPI002A824982|nr:zinc transporter ZIP1-like [Saccostrea echinata]
MDIISVKVLILFGLFLLTVILGLLPLKIVSYVRKRSGSSVDLHKQIVYKRTISLLNCFAAGVFLATVVLDLLPGVRSSLTTALKALKAETEFPIAEFVMSFGLFAILGIEQVVLTYKENQIKNQGSVKTPLLANSSDILERQQSLTESVRSEHSISGITDQPFQNSRRNSRALDNGAALSDDEERSESHGHSHEIEFPHEHSLLRSLLLLLALSLHSLFEGLAVGLQEETDQVIQIFAALALHKSILSFSLGMNVAQSKMTLKGAIKSVLLFSISAPIGVGVGIGIIRLWDSKASNLVQGILQGIACGTFLYITFFEVLPHEFNNCDSRLLKVIFLLLGFAAVTAIVYFHH